MHYFQYSEFRAARPHLRHGAAAPFDLPGRGAVGDLIFRFRKHATEIGRRRRTIPWRVIALPCKEWLVIDEVATRLSFTAETCPP